MSVQRVDIICDDYGLVEESSSGKFVRWKDAEKVVKALEEIDHLLDCVDDVGCQECSGMSFYEKVNEIAFEALHK